MAETKNPEMVKKVVKNYDKMLAAFGGMVVGKALSHFLDKQITSKPVEGLLGVEMSEKVSKVVKPLVVTGVGMTAFALSKNSHLKYAGIGCAGIGVSELANATLGKDYLAGLGDANLSNEDFEIIDIDSGMPIPPATNLELPKLSGETPMDSNYQEDEEVEEFPYVEEIEELEAA